MTTVVLGWDLDRGSRWVPPYEDTVARIQRNGTATAPWQLGHGPAPSPGTCVHLMLQGQTRGLVGRGVVRSAPFQAVDADRPGTLTTHVLIEWDRLLPLTERVPAEMLATKVPCFAWQTAYRDLQELPADAEGPLDLLWAEPHPGAAHTLGWYVVRLLDSARALAGQLSRAIIHP